MAKSVYGGWQYDEETKAVPVTPDEVSVTELGALLLFAVLCVLLVGIALALYLAE